MRRGAVVYQRFVTALFLTCGFFLLLTILIFNTQKTLRGALVDGVLCEAVACSVESSRLQVDAVLSIVWRHLVRFQFVELAGSCCRLSVSFQFS
jgi:hypothetical protein